MILMIFGSKHMRKVSVCILVLLFFCAGASAGDIPVKDKHTKDAVRDVEDAVKGNTDYLKEATEALATTISGGLVAQSEGINASIGNMTSQIVEALSRQSLAEEKIKLARIHDPAISKVSPGSCGRANVVGTTSKLIEGAMAKARSMSGKSAAHHSKTSSPDGTETRLMDNSARVVSLAGEETGLIDVRGITRSATVNGATLDEDVNTAASLDTLINPHPASSASEGGKTLESEAVAAVYNSKKLVVSDTLSDIIASRIAPEEVSDPHILRWAGSAGATSVDGVVSMSKESYRVIKNTYRRQSIEWLKHIETASEPLVPLRDIAMAMAQQLENQEEIIQLLTKSLTIQAFSFSQLVDNEMPGAAGDPEGQ
jgi:hypothetical protein